MNRVLRILLLPIATVTVAAGLLITSPGLPQAHADELAYMAELTAHGIYGVPNYNALVNLGYRACNDARAGYTLGETATNIYLYWNPTGTLTMDGAYEVARAANIWLC